MFVLSYVLQELIGLVVQEAFPHSLSINMDQVNEKLTKEVLKYVHMLISLHIFLPDRRSYGGDPLLDASLWLAATASDVCSSQITVH